jgi:hypothetical protein
VMRHVNGDHSRQSSHDAESIRKSRGSQVIVRPSPEFSEKNEVGNVRCQLQGVAVKSR